MSSVDTTTSSHFFPDPLPPTPGSPFYSSYLCVFAACSSIAAASPLLPSPFSSALMPLRAHAFSFLVPPRIKKTLPLVDIPAED